MIDAGSARVVSSGLGLLEGPVWHEGSLFVVSVNRGLIYRITPDTGLSVEFAEPGGGPNGLAIDADGTIWIAQNGATRTHSSSAVPARPGLQHIISGTPAVVANVLESVFDAPNDCAIDARGHVWFTDPPAHPDHRPMPGRLIEFDPQTGESHARASGILFPNGLAFDFDREILYLVETGHRRILRYALLPDGGLGPMQTHAILPEGDPDGICLDEIGNIYVATGPGNSLVVVAADGRIIQQVHFSGTTIDGPGFFPTNLCFGGSLNDTLYVTLASGGRVVAFDNSSRGAATITAPRLMTKTRTVSGRENGE